MPKPLAGVSFRSSSFALTKAVVSHFAPRGKTIFVSRSLKRASAVVSKSGWSAERKLLLRMMGAGASVGRVSANLNGSKGDPGPVGRNRTIDWTGANR